MKKFLSSLQKDISDFTTLSPQVKFLLVVQLIILFILSILVGVLFSPRFTGNVRQNPDAPELSQESQATTQLSLEPNDHIMQIGEDVLMNVTMSGAPSTAVDVVLTYDPAVLEISDVTNGEVYEREIYNEITTEGGVGKVYFSAAQPLEEDTDGAVFGFVATAIQKVETSPIEFDLDLTITAENGVNTLGVAQPAEIHVFD